MVGKKDYPTCVAALSSGEDDIQAVVFDSVTQEFISNSAPCDKWAVGEVFSKSNFGIGLAYSNDTTAKRLISEAILTLRENGVIENILDNWLQVGACADPSSLSADTLSLIDLSGAFAVLALFVVCAIISLIIERIFFNWYHQSAKNQYPITKHIDRFFGNSEPDKRTKRLPEEEQKRHDEKLADQ